MTSAPPATQRAEVEQLLEASMARRSRRLERRELSIEFVLSAVFVAFCVALLLLPGPSPSVDPVALLIVGAYAFASRVDYPIATGFAVPTQMFLVGLFAHADVRIVPLLVLAGLAVGTFSAWLCGHSRLDRLSLCGADAMHALGPAALFALVGVTDATAAGWWLIGAAFLAQCAVEFVSSTVRDWLVMGMRPRMQALVLLQVWLADLALTPVGITAVAASSTVELAPLALLPLVVLASHTARDRTERTERLGARLDALHRERGRLQVAVRRIGDAFASNLDLDALVSIVAHASVEALDAEGGRAIIVEAGVQRTSFAPDAAPPADALLRTVSAHALRGEATFDAEADGLFARAIPIWAADAPVAVVSIARTDAFTDAEGELFAHLCLQASIAADNIVAHEQLHVQALTDELTGLANHRRMQDLLSIAVEAGTAEDLAVSFLLIDLDDFKAVNDTYGHQVGDRVLRAVAHCLRAYCREGDEPARYGGEELAVVLADTDVSDASALAERLREAIERLEITAPDGSTIRVTVSIGLATLGRGTATKAALIAAADTALYVAKAAGKNRLQVAAQRGRAALPTGRRGIDVLEDVREGIAADAFRLHYQPKVQLPDLHLVGVEALLRWRHPTRGLLGPAEFLGDVEGTELMPELTRWVLRSAARQAVAWRARGMAVPVAVNVSAQDLADPSLCRTVAGVLRETRALPSDLRLEITEHLAVRDSGRAVSILDGLRDIGVGLSLDDFGSGYSSLSRLGDLPVDEIKLDRGFLRSPDRAIDLAVARAVIGLGRDLGLTVIAEGIEDPKVLPALQEMGCDLIQGFVISPALSANDLERWMERRSPTLLSA